MRIEVTGLKASEAYPEAFVVNAIMLRTTRLLEDLQHCNVLKPGGTVSIFEE